MLPVIDNYASFTCNLVQYVCELGCFSKVVRNDQIDMDGIHNANLALIVISPGLLYAE